ncbi:MAG: hypothetical protein KME60_02105 [Cyanomargarita calcarea GSE-NOS-MK-12-04C]|uniref:Uncharacterized protein n=1 Tax=Cyanomargarita calcarea GSE-NOS-MK-12-04C TaxID=2839659 RepID=A0A951QH66_9CYAN|nr:hypothetical protein [Cyanomargarita calcarea GSE-NOS-MK-12-04C]
MQSQEIKERLTSLIEEASAVDPNLEKRLEEIYHWIKNVKLGSLTAKRFVILFLQQMISDSQIWLDIQALTSQEEQQAYYGEMTATEKYWYGELFSKWLSENDPKFYIWKRKLMAEEFSQQDATLIDSITSTIKFRGGTIVQRYVADLSMATDIIVSSRQEKALCIQLTSLSNEFSIGKSDNWETTLRFWEIERGLFLSYNPGTSNFVNQIANIILYNSDNLKASVYLKFHF